MIRTSIALSLVAALVSAAPQERSAAVEARYPPSTALAEGLSPEELDALAALVRSFVDEGEVVGAELHVIAHGRTILHEGYGWRDRDDEPAMQPGGVFCVRSMTKPAFDNPEQAGITVEQLLTHTSGLPLSLIIGAPTPCASCSNPVRTPCADRRVFPACTRATAR